MKRNDRKGKILLVDASHNSCKKGHRSILTSEDISKILNCLDSFSDIEDYSKVVANEQISAASYDLEVGRYVDASPEALQIKRLIRQYNGYRLISLSELAIDANYVNIDAPREKTENILYVGNHFVSRSLSGLDSECHSVLRVLLDSSQVLSGYLELFMQSEIGSPMLAKLRARELMLRPASLLSLWIPLPEYSMQVRMTQAAARLEDLKAGIQQLEKELIFSPPSAFAVLEQVNGMLDAVGSLTDADLVMSLIRKGESKTVEFKETFSLDVRKNSSEKYIELSSLKTIAAFLNTDGGCLLVGVDDAGSIVGLERDIERFHNSSKDKFLLHFKNNLKSRIGEENYPFINQRLVAVGGLPILLVECKKSTNGCFVDGKDFYVRTNPSTDKLEGAKLISYIKNNFLS